MKRRTVVLLAACAAVVAAAAGSVVAAQGAPDKSVLFISVTSDDLWDCQMAMGYAERVNSMGYRVVLFLNVRGVYLANKNLPQATMAGLQKTPADMLKSLMQRGIDVYVCPMCMAQAGMKTNDLLDGTKEADPGMVSLQMDPNTQVMSY
jgi:predicted peroxiredoxin